MDYGYLYQCILKAYKDYGINAFPIDGFRLIQQHGFKVKKYCELTPVKRAACWKLSEDACLIENTLYYNESAFHRRIVFTIAHELGHHFLETSREDDADEFASHFLAPRILIHKYGYQTADQIHDTFGLSYAASNRALASYKKWFAEIAHSIPRRPSDPELQLEQIFFPVKETPLVCSRADETCCEETAFDPVDKYLYILRVLKSGLDVPPEYRRTVERYRRMGIRLN